MYQVLRIVSDPQKVNRVYQECYSFGPGLDLSWVKLLGVKYGLHILSVWTLDKLCNIPLVQFPLLLRGVHNKI